MGSKTYTSNNVSRMIEDEYIKPTTQMAVLSYTSSRDSGSTKLSSKSLVDYMNEAKANSIVQRLKTATRHSKAEGYAYGPLVSNMSSASSTSISAAIGLYSNAMYKATAVIQYGEYAHTNYLHFARWTLQESYGYNPISNEVTSESARIGKPVYLKDIVLHINPEVLADLDDASQIVMYGNASTSGYTPFRTPMVSRSHTAIVSDSNVTDAEAYLVMCYDNAGVETEYVITMEYSNYISPHEAPDGSLGEDMEEEWDSSVISPTLPNTYLDAKYLMAYFTYTLSGVTYGEYITYRVGSLLNTYLEDAVIKNQFLGSYVPRVYARMKGKKCNAEDLEDTDKYKSMVKLGKRLGFNWSNWVDDLHESISSLRYIREIFMTTGVQVNNKKDDPIINQYLYHYFQQIYTVLDPVSMTTTLLNSDVLSWNARQGKNINIEDNEHRSGFQFSGIGYGKRTGKLQDVGTYTAGYIAGYHWFRFQETESSYTEVRVYSLVSYDDMTGGPTFMPSGTSEDLIIPLDLSVRAKLSTTELEMLYSKSLQIVVNTSQTVKKKWYQTGVFKVVMFIIAVVVTYFYPPGGAALSSWMAAAYAVAVSVAVTVAVSLASRLLIKLGVDGGALSAIMTIIAIVAFIYGGYLNMSGTSAGVGGVTAQTMLTVSSSAFSMATTGREAQLKQMMDSYQSALAEMSEKEKELKEQAEALGLLNVPTPAMLIFETTNSLDIRIGEDPEDYYERSIHTSNVGTYVFNYQESYVESNTALPSITTLLSRLENNYGYNS